MDITGGSYRPTYMQQARRIYGRLTGKGKVVLAIIALIIMYLIFPSWGGNNDNDEPTKQMNFPGFEKRQYNTVSDLLNNSPSVSPIELQYLNLPPFLNNKNEFDHYVNGGNMLLSRSADYVRLVRDQPRQNGYLFSKATISANDLSAIEATIEFKIHGEQEKQGVIGDGMALWFTTEQLQQGDVFGMQSNYNGLGLFIDTYKNYNTKKNRHSFPYLSLQRNNGFAGHYNKEKDGIDTQLGGCALHRSYNNGDKHSKLRFTYIRQANVLEIDFDTNGDGDWRTCFRKENVAVDEIFPVGRPLYFGVSAETGELHHSVDVHSIDIRSYRNKDGSLITSLDSLGEGIQMSTYGDDTEANSEAGSATRRKRRSLERLKRQERKLKEQDKLKYGSEHGFVGWFFGLVWKFVKLCFYVGIALVGVYACVIAYRIYQDKQRKKNRGGLL